MLKQRTIKKQVSFNGFGIHTAKFAEVTLSPLPENSGIRFRDQSTAVQYLPENVRADARGTQVAIKEDHLIMTVEHLVSAIAGLGIDNILIDVEGPEVPIKDGSTLFFIEKIKEAEIVEQDAPKKMKTISKPVSLIAEDKFIIALPAAELSISYLLDYPLEEHGCDFARYTYNPENYEQFLGSARTFGLKSEVEALWASNKGLGATIENALVISRDGFSNRLNYDNELARHKIVDFLGDITALGELPLAEFLIAKSGHQFNQAFVKELAKC